MAIAVAGSRKPLHPQAADKIMHELTLGRLEVSRTLPPCRELAGPVGIGGELIEGATTGPPPAGSS